MSAEATRATKRNMHYDFFQSGFLEPRIESVNESIKTTLALFNQVVVTVDAVTVERLIDLLHSEGGGNYSAYISQVDQKKASSNLAPLSKKLKEDIDQQKLGHLNKLLAQLIDAGQLVRIKEPVSTHTLDGDFELKQLLNLYTLCHRLINFFWINLKNAAVKSVTSHEAAGTLPPLHLIRECFRRVSLDLEILQGAIMQRRWHIGNSGESVMSAQARALLVTDKMTLMSLAPAAHLLTETIHLTPITYFSKRTHIRRLPYTDDYLMVGISYDYLVPELNRWPKAGKATTAENPYPAFELMAIPHEVGHFMYRHAQLKDKRSFGDVAEPFKSHRYYHWCEEIFADVYGCMVAGSLTALGLQALLAFSDSETFTKDDGEHPAAIIRPFLLSDILREWSLKEPNHFQFASLATQLDENWSEILRKHGFVFLDEGGKESVRVKLTGTDSDYFERVVNITKARASIRPIINAFVAALRTEAKFDPWPNTASTNVSAKIPWVKGKETSLAKHNAVMANLTNSNFATKRLSDHLLISTTAFDGKYTAGADPDQQLRDFLAHWHDAGPSGGHGDHPI